MSIDTPQETENEGYKEPTSPSTDIKNETNLGKSDKAHISPLSGYFTGLYWIVQGFLILVYNLFPSFSNSIFLEIWGPLLLGIYLVFTTLLGFIRKIYFILGIILLALFLRQVIFTYADGASLAQRISWPIIMSIISLAVIAYAVFFKRHSKKFVSYIVVGVALIIFSVLAFLAALQVFDFSQVLQKIWPIFLILLGFSYMQRLLFIRKTHKKIKDTKEVPK